MQKHALIEHPSYYAMEAVEDGKYYLVSDVEANISDLIASKNRKHRELARKYGMLTDENKQLRELVDGAEDIVELYGASRPGLTEGQEGWKKEWLRKARQALRGGEDP